MGEELIKYDVYWLRGSPKTTAVDNQLPVTEKDIEQRFPSIEEAKKYVKIIEAKGISGSKFNPYLQELKIEIKSGRVASLTFYKTDRVARTVEECYRVMNLCREHNVRVRSLSEGYDTDTPAGKAMFGLCAIFAELEADLNRERVILKLQELKEGGKKLGRPKGSKDKRQRKRRGYFEFWDKRQNAKTLQKVMSRRVEQSPHKEEAAVTA